MAQQEYLPTRILHDFVGRVESLGMKYMLTGSMAMMLYGMFRQTADIDIVVEFDGRDLIAFERALQPDYYVPVKSMNDAVSARRVFNVINIEFAYKIDCVVRKDSSYHKTAFDRRLRTDYYGREVWIITCEDLILSKLLWAAPSRSEKQMTDVENLMSFGYDAAYTEAWIDSLGITEIYLECKAKSTA